MPQGCVDIIVNGERLIADPAGAAYWPEQDALLVADLHFEKGSAFAAKGQMLPPYDTRATLRSLDTVLARHSPSTVIALGDSFHDGEAGERISEVDMASIQSLTAARRWVWLTGNHDEVLPDGIGGKVAAELAFGSLTLRHEPQVDACDGLSLIHI